MAQRVPFIVAELGADADPFMLNRYAAHPEQFAARIMPIIRPLQDEGASFRQIARTLNERGVSTARDGKWAATQVSDIIRRHSDNIFQSLIDKNTIRREIREREGSGTHPGAGSVVDRKLQG